MNNQRNIRLIPLFFFFIILYMMVLTNLYSIQIKKADFFKALGQQQYRVTLTTMPPRAEIYDRTGIQTLAMNKEVLSAFIMPSRLEHPESLRPFLAHHFPQAYNKLEKNRSLHFMYIKRRLSDQQIKLIQESELSDIKFLKEATRFYPIESVGPIVGITNINNQGIMGVELHYNAQLTGKPSTHILQKEARSGHFYFKRETKIQGTKGQFLTLSIDSALQFLAYEELQETVTQLEAKEGAILILNPDNGEVLAMANYPDFDPNNTEHLDMEYTKNRIVTDAYELGSVIKAFLALAALEEGVVTPDELIDCENTKSITLDGIKFSTLKAHGIVPFSKVIQGSNNIGVAKVAQRLGPKLYEHYKRLGFGQKIGGFIGENKGYITPPDHWSKASIISLSFGYEISATLLQLAYAMTIIANDGYGVKPRLTKQAPDEHTSKIGPLYNQQTITCLKDILRKTVSESIINQATHNGYRIMGKTGTARLLTDGKYDSKRLLCTFAAILQKDDYKRIIITCIKEAKIKNAYGATIAAPLCEHITQKMLIHDKIITLSPS
jgi:cell division protein FtsI (penicillin-binding protein 3)